MPIPIVLLTGPLEVPLLAEILWDIAPEAEIEAANDVGMLRHVLAEAPPESRLVAFCTDSIVPAALLQGLAGPAYNFHPGPPEYRGSRVASFAVYDGVERFGATAHEITSEIDAGAIVGVRRFEVPPGVKFGDLEGLAFEALLDLFQELAPRLLADPAPLPALAEERWSGPLLTRAQAERLARVEADLSEDEIRRRYRAFG